MQCRIEIDTRASRIKKKMLFKKKKITKNILYVINGTDKIKY